MLIEHLLEIVIPYITGSLELIGVAIISISSLRCLFKLFTNGFNFKDDDIAIELAKSLTLSLEFKLAGEIVKTVVIRTLDEFIVLACVAILRVVLSFVLHWELTSGTKNLSNYCPTDNDINIEGDKKIDSMSSLNNKSTT
jgi:uncharacterized membrane protein